MWVPALSQTIQETKQTQPTSPQLTAVTPKGKQAESPPGPSGCPDQPAAPRTQGTGSHSGCRSGPAAALRAGRSERSPLAAAPAGLGLDWAAPPQGQAGPPWCSWGSASAREASTPPKSFRDTGMGVPRRRFGRGVRPGTATVQAGEGRGAPTAAAPQVGAPYEGRGAPPPSPRRRPGPGPPGGGREARRRRAPCRRLTCARRRGPEGARGQQAAQEKPGSRRRRPGPEAREPSLRSSRSVRPAAARRDDVAAQGPPLPRHVITRASRPRDVMTLQRESRPGLHHVTPGPGAGRQRTRCGRSGTGWAGRSAARPPAVRGPADGGRRDPRAPELIAACLPRGPSGARPVGNNPRRRPVRPGHCPPPPEVTARREPRSSSRCRRASGPTACGLLLSAWVHVSDLGAAAPGLPRDEPQPSGSPPGFTRRLHLSGPLSAPKSPRTWRVGERGGRVLLEPPRRVGEGPEAPDDTFWKTSPKSRMQTCSKDLPSPVLLHTATMCAPDGSVQCSPMRCERSVWFATICVKRLGEYIPIYLGMHKVHLERY